MLLTKDVEEQANITKITLVRWNKAGLLKSKTGVHPESRRGRVSFWPYDTLEKIKEIRANQKKGHTLEEIKILLDRKPQQARLVINPQSFSYLLRDSFGEAVFSFWETPLIEVNLETPWEKYIGYIESDEQPDFAKCGDTSEYLDRYKEWQEKKGFSKFPKGVKSEHTNVKKAFLVELRSDWINISQFNALIEGVRKEDLLVVSLGEILSEGDISFAIVPGKLPRIVECTVNEMSASKWVFRVIGYIRRPTKGPVELFKDVTIDYV